MKKKLAENLKAGDVISGFESENGCHELWSDNWIVQFVQHHVDYAGISDLSIGLKNELTSESQIVHWLPETMLLVETPESYTKQEQATTGSWQTWKPKTEYKVGDVVKTELAPVAHAQHGLHVHAHAEPEPPKVTSLQNPPQPIEVSVPILTPQQLAFTLVHPPSQLALDLAEAVSKPLKAKSSRNTYFLWTVKDRHGKFNTNDICMTRQEARNKKRQYASKGLGVKVMRLVMAPE